METRSRSDDEENMDDFAPLLPLEPTTNAAAAAGLLADNGGEVTAAVVELAETGLNADNMELNSSGSESRAGSSTVHVLPYLYGSHFLSRWGDRMWEFAVPLFMIQIWPDSLLLAAGYGLAEGASVAIFGAIVGNWVDRNQRLKVIQISLAVQNISVIVAAVALVPLLGFPESFPGRSNTFIALVAVVNLCGAVAALGGLASNLVVERDWVVVISENQTPAMLPQMNSLMRRIDLSCKLLAPLLVGVIMSGVSALSCAVMIALSNAVSVVLEYWFLHWVYWSIPALQQKGAFGKAGAGSRDLEVLNSELVSLHGGYNEVEVDNGVVNQNNKSIQGRHFLDNLFLSWRVYCHQEMVLAGVALALLYFTVLSFGSVMTAVLDWRGVPAYVLGLARAIAALVGILATVAYPVVQSRLETIRTGLWSIWLQWSLLSLCATSVLVHNDAVSSAMLIGGLAASRFGLWMFDLSVTQLMQEGIQERERGVVGGVQNSLQATLDMLSYVVAIIISDPKKFWILVIMSYGSVGLAAVLYARYVRKSRGHLLHLDRVFQKLRLL